MSLEEFTITTIRNLFNITNDRLAESLGFFVYDTLKILFLLFFMIFLVGTLRTYIPTYKVKKYLSGKRVGVGNVLASVFGAVTPFCSCSSIPIFFSMIDAGVPLGVGFSFLITSPLVNEYVAVLMLSVFGLKVTIYYIAAGMLMGIIGGLILGRMKLEKYLVKNFLKQDKNKEEKVYKYFSERISFGLHEATDVLKKTWIYAVIGIGAAAIIHGYVPDAFFSSMVNKGGIFAVPIATIIGVPLYASCAALIPIAAAFVSKGIPLGTSLAFLMSTAALSFPEAVMLRRAMKLKLIAIFFGIVALSIMIIGYLFNWII